MALNQFQFQFSSTRLDTLRSQLVRTGQGPVEDGLHGADNLLKGDLQISPGLFKPGNRECCKKITGAYETGIKPGELDSNPGRGVVLVDSSG